MPNIKLNHESVDQAVAEMQQATQQMTTNMDQLMQELQQVSSSFSGQAADAWRQLQQAYNQADAAMTNDFGKGHVVLADMHATLRSGDAKGAQIMGG